MKKLLGSLLGLLVIAAIGYGVYRYFLAPSSERSCDRVAKLCGGKGEQATESCVKIFGKLEKAGGESAAQTHECIREAESCAAAVGCMVGGSLGAAGEFLKGLKGAIEKKSQ